MNETASILHVLRLRPEARLVAIAGIPGSGKSTLAAELVSQIPRSIIVPMDGYHLPRAQLRPADLARRGAPHTFDVISLRRDLAALKSRRSGSFPTFDHAVKDPQPDAIQITPEHGLVIVEGLYLLLSTWDLAPLFDLTFFIDCDVDEAMSRVARRHVESGIATDAEDARRRVASNDRLNALTIINDGCRGRADHVLS